MKAWKKEYMVNLTYEDLKIIEQKFFGNYKGLTVVSNKVLEKLNQAVQGTTKEPKETNLKEEEYMKDWEKVKEKIKKIILRDTIVSYGKLINYEQTAISILEEVFIPYNNSTLKELQEKIEGMKKEIRFEELDTGIGIDRLEYDGQEEEHGFNEAIDRVLSLIDTMVEEGKV